MYQVSPAQTNSDSTQQDPKKVPSKITNIGLKPNRLLRMFRDTIISLYGLIMFDYFRRKDP